MKRKNLLELELSIPTINLVESRTLSGGSRYGPEGPFPWDPDLWPMGFPGVRDCWSDFWDRQAERREDEDRDPNDCPWGGADGPDWKWNEDQEGAIVDDGDERPPDPDEFRDEDQNQDNEPSNDKPVVPDGHCATGTIAAAIHRVFGGTGQDALDTARTTLENLLDISIDLSIPHPDRGIPISMHQIGGVLEDLGFVDVNHNIAFTNWLQQDGHYTIANLAGQDGSPWHLVLLLDFDPTTMLITYYDSTKGDENRHIHISALTEIGGRTVSFRGP